MTTAPKPSELLLANLDYLRVAARNHAATNDLTSAADLAAAAIQVSLAILLDQSERLPPDKQDLFLPAIRQLFAELQAVTPKQP